MSDEQKMRQYHIYGRKFYAEPLAYVQSRNAQTMDFLPTPEGGDWVEVVAFPASAVIQVIPREKEDERSH
jgi:hypothetical protein